MKSFLHKIKGKIQYWKRTIIVYVWKPDFLKFALPQKSDFIYIEFKDLNDFPSDSLNPDLQSIYKARFDQQHLCCAFLKNGIVVSFGWVNPENHHYIGELNLTLTIDNRTEVLYDFFTHENYRGLGLYPLLLQFICLRNNTTKLIYILSDNANSKKGIEKANFKHFTSIRGLNKGKLKKGFKKT
jgi:hypothetical protein